MNIYLLSSNDIKSKDALAVVQAHSEDQVHRLISEFEFNTISTDYWKSEAYSLLLQRVNVRSIIQRDLDLLKDIILSLPKKFEVFELDGNASGFLCIAKIYKTGDKLPCNWAMVRFNEQTPKEILSASSGLEQDVLGVGSGGSRMYFYNYIDKEGVF